MKKPSPNKKPRAVLVGVQLPGTSEAEMLSSLRELGRLVQTLDFEVIHTIVQKRSSLEPSTLIGEGKLMELAQWTDGKGKVQSLVPQIKSKLHKESHQESAEDNGDEKGPQLQDEKATIVIFDHELKPGQLRNLENATGVEVLDRTGVIVEIFGRHALTREARLQVEMAQLKYLAPRLRASGGKSERQGGGIGGKGAGETSHELDRRRIRNRVAEIKQQLSLINQDQENRRLQREEVPRVVLVGYTNAGKSSLMRVLTGSEVLVQDKLFATLDTKVRVLWPETRPRILMSDTVGFINKLPHDLIASFRSTLDEARHASLLLYVVDASDPSHLNQLEVTQKVLAEIGTSDIPCKFIFNKMDCLHLKERNLFEEKIRETFAEAIFMSSHAAQDVSALRDVIINFCERNMQDEKFLVPYDKSKLIGDIHDHVRVLSQDSDENGIHFKVRAHPHILLKIRQWLL